MVCMCSPYIHISGASVLRGDGANRRKGLVGGALVMWGSSTQNRLKYISLTGYSGLRL